jgi:hypothetical protein
MTLDTLTQPPTQIYTPRLLDFRSIPLQEGAIFRRSASAFEIIVRSAMNGQSYKLVLRGPKKNLNPIDGPALRQIFSGDYVLLSVFLDRKHIDFSSQESFLFAIHCDSCELAEVPPVK